MIGVDVGDGMLSVARHKPSRVKSRESCWEDVEYYRHDISRLEGLEPIRGKIFDAVTCAFALFLLSEVVLTRQSSLGSAFFDMEVQ